MILLDLKGGTAMGVFFILFFSINKYMLDLLFDKCILFFKE